MWASITEFLGQAWVHQTMELAIAVITVIGMLFAYFHRKNLFRIIKNIERNTKISKISSHKAEDSNTLPDDGARRPPPQPKPTASRDLPDRPRMTARYAPHTGERPFSVGRQKSQFTQSEFDIELQKMLKTQKEEGNNYYVVISRDLHRRVVGGSHPNRMPMACEAMSKIWRKQGRKKENITYTTPRGRSSTIQIRYDLSFV